jgi:hypothetical protein
MERKIFVCECSSLEHQVSFWYDEDENTLYVETHLVTHKNFFKRLWVGLKYAFGYKSRFGEWDEILLDPKSQKELYQWLQSKYK